MKDEGFRILGYVVVMYIIALLPIRRVLGIALLFVACSVFILRKFCELVEDEDEE
mgnify:CR=1 FL=1